MNRWCTACLVEHPVAEFYRDRKAPSGYRAECKAAFTRRNLEGRQRRAKPKPRPKTLDDLDDARAAGLCLHRIYRPDACQARATWRGRGDSHWQACDQHRLARDLRIPAPVRLREPDAEAWG